MSSARRFELHRLEVFFARDELFALGDLLALDQVRSADRFAGAGVQVCISMRLLVSGLIRKRIVSASALAWIERNRTGDEPRAQVTLP
jgi:hypothetical protein